MQGYVNLKGYREFAAQNRPEGWNVWLMLSISPKAPEAVARRRWQCHFRFGSFASVS